MRSVPTPKSVLPWAFRSAPSNNYWFERGAHYECALPKTTGNTKIRQMNMGDLQLALDRYGSDFARWPAAERGEAEAMFAANPHAATLLATARRLDRAVEAAMTPMDLDSAFVGRIVAHVGERAHHDVAVRPTPRLFAWAGAAVFAFLITGFAAGLALPASQGEDVFAGLMFGSSASTDAVDAVTDTGSLL